MFRCPITGTRLIKARAGGGTIWYSPDSDGRMLTVATARHFFGPDKTREIWMRSDRVEPLSDNRCPSCQHHMRRTPIPDWVGSGTVDVCRTCRIFWIEGSDFYEIPKGSQLLHEKGDSTLVKDLGEAYLEHDRLKFEQATLHADGPTTLPLSAVETIFGFLALPIERSNRPTPEWTVISAALIVGMCFLEYWTDYSLISEFGFYPNHPFKNYGFNIFAHVFLHAGWFHVLGNCYFAYVLSDDVEDDLGPSKFFLFLVFVIVSGAIISTLISGSRDVPHVGFSGVVMALFAYYGLQFPKAKMIWMLPTFKLYGWFQFRTLWVALFYLAGNVIHYYASEKYDLGSVSYSGHIAGFIAGGLFWLIAAPKTFERPKRDILESGMDRLLTQEVSPKTPPALKPPSKRIE